MGRPTKLTQPIQDAILAAIATGATRDVAAASVGVHRTTLFEWLAKGRQAQAPAVYRYFADAVEKAEADATIAMIQVIRTAANTTWQAAAWYLERKYPDDWGRKDRLSIEALKRTEAERVARDLGLDPEEVLAAVDSLLAGSN